MAQDTKAEKANINFNNILQFCNKYKTYIICTLSVLIFLFSRLWQPINWSVLPLFAIFAVFANVTQIYSAFMFLYSFAGIFSVFVGAAGGNIIPLSPVVMIISGLILLIKHGVQVAKKKQKVALVPAILSVCLFGYGFLFFNVANYYRIMALFMVLVMAYVTFAFYADIDFTKVVRATVLGILVSTLICLLLQFIPSQYHFVWNGNRFQSLSGHPNNLQIGCVVTISLLMVLRFKKKIKLLEFIVSAILVSVIGIFTLSKAYYLCLAGIIFIYMIAILRKNRIKGLWQCLAILVSVGIICLVFRKQCVAFFDRFTMFFTDGTIWDQITTGRATIWGTFWKAWLSSPISIIFGQGLSANEPVSIGSHNDILYILFHTGLVGLVLSALLVGSYVYLVRDKKDRIHLINILPILLLFLLSLQENILLKTEFIFIILAFAFIFDKKQIIEVQPIECNNDKVSVIVPCYNSEKTIAKCVDSILSQSYTNFELIIVNDGSTDASAQVIDQYSKHDNVKVINKTNGGVSSARNCGLKEADGKYICFVDSDDWLEPYYLQGLVCAIESGNYQMACCGYKEVGKDYSRDCVWPRDQYNLPNDINELYLNAQFGYPWNKLFIRELIVGNFNENLNFGEDELFVLQYLTNVTSIVCTKSCLYNYYQSPNSLVGKAFNNFFEINKILYGYRHNIMQDAVSNEASEQLAGNKLIKAIVINTGYDIAKGVKYHQLKQKIDAYCNDEMVLQCISKTKMQGTKDKVCKWFIEHKYSWLIYVASYLYIIRKKNLDLIY